MSRRQPYGVDYSFEDLFFNNEGVHVNEEELPSLEGDSPSGNTAKGDRGVSALTLTLNQLQLEQNETASGVDDLRRDVERKWSAIHARHDNPSRLGSSAPVWIPQRSLTWSAHQYDRLQEINENTDGDLQRATTFVPPHLTVEQPVIQFSLNSGLANKRARLKTREKILSFMESDESAFVDASDFRIPTGGPSGLSRELGGSSSNMCPRPPAA